MKRFTRACVALSLCVMLYAALHETARADGQDHKTSPLAGNYMLYSGSLADSDSPTKRDAKVAITFTGKLAVEMFRRLGPSARIESCGADETTRARNDLICIAPAGKGAVQCYIGIDILKGRSINGITC